MIELEQDEKLDLNVATFEQLKGLCGIGPKLAERITDRRPFNCIDDLKAVPGIGEKRFDKLEKQCVVHGNRRPPSGLPSHVNRISFLDPRTGDHICQYIFAEEFRNLSNSDTGLLIFHVNAGKYQSSLFEMENIIMSSLHPPDIVCVSDTGNRSVSSSFLDDYIKFKFPKHDSRIRGKGVAIFVKKSRHGSCNERSDLKFLSNDCDNLWVELSYFGFPPDMRQFYTMVIGVVYRNPSEVRDKIETFCKNLQNVISKIKNEGKIFYILGDFNMDVRKYNNYIVQYCEMLEDEDCKLLITKPTRVGIKDDAQGLLDHIYTNDPNLQNVTSGIVETHDVSDHYPIYCHLDFTYLTAINKQENARTNLKLRTMLQPSVPSLKIKGIPYSPLLPISPFDLFELVLHKGLAPLTTHQTKLLGLFCLPSWFETQIPDWYSSCGFSNVVIFGYKILSDYLENVFYGSKQSYFIPVNIFSQFNLQIGSGYIIANTVNGPSFEEQDPSWVFVPIACNVFRHLPLNCRY